MKTIKHIILAALVLVFTYGTCVAQDDVYNTGNKTETKENNEKTNKRIINTGYVFIDGKYIDAPYNINFDAKSIYINGKKICTLSESYANVLTHTKYPGYPDCLNKLSCLEDISNCYLSEKDMTYVKAASLYFIANYDYTIANDSIIDYYRHLPNIESITQKNGPFYNVSFYNGRMLTMYFSVNRLELLYPENIKQEHSQEIDSQVVENHISHIQTLLDDNKLLFFFSEQSIYDYLITEHKNIDIINNVINGEFTQQVKIDSLATILYNKKLIENLVNYENLDLKLPVNHDADFFMQDTNKTIKQGNFVKDISEGTIAYSPERNKIKAFCPAIYETNTFGNFLTQEFENVKNKIQGSGYNNTIVYTEFPANAEVFPIVYSSIKHLADDAGFIYIASHGGVDEGMLLIRGITEEAIYNWIADINDISYMQIANVPDAYKPVQWASNLECWEAYAKAEWATLNWGTNLVANKTITILSICNGYNNGWINACAGGACFAYDGETNFTSASRHNDSLLNNMNSSSGNGQYRLASQAYNKVKQDVPTSNLKFIGNGEVTLCPGIVSKLPDNLSIVNSSGNGYIALDTWCNSDIDLNVSSSLSPVSFSTQGNIVVFDLAWDNPVGGKANRINFSWLNSSSQNSGIVTVYINAEKFQSTPAILNEYHTLNPTVEPTSYSFQVNALDESLLIISGKVYDALTSNHVTSGTVKDTDNPASFVAINSQGEYSISVNQGWSGSLTASAPGYASKTQPFNPVWENNWHDFYLSEMPNVYITSSTNNVYPGVPITFQAHNVPAGCNYYWDFSDSGTDTDWSIATSPSYVFSVPGTYNVSLVLKHSNTGDIITTVWHEITIKSYTGPFYRPSFTTNCNVVNIGTEVFFYDNSYFPVQFRLLWKWFFELGTENNESDFFYKPIGDTVSVDYLTVSHTYNSIGHKIVKLQSYDPTGHIFGFLADVLDEYNTNWDESFSAFGGVNVIDCDLMSVLFTHPLFSSGIFLGAVYDDWVYNNNNGPLYIYGGSFLFNGTANNHLNRDLPITISACNEIIITGDVEFVASGEEELILEINNSPCLQGNTQRLTKAKQDFTSPNIFSCYPNPFIDVINIYISLQKEQKINISILDMLGKQFFQKNANFSKGESLVNINLSLLKPGTYIIKLFNSNINETFKIIKTY